MDKKEEFLGDYDKLSPQVVELAYSTNEQHNLRLAYIRAKSEVTELEKSDRDQLSSSLLALKESGVSGDELLKSYDKIIRANSDIKRINEFEDMLLLGARLVPGEVVMIDGEVLVVATPTDDTEAFALTPCIVEVGRISSDEVIYGFEWAVPVIGKEEMVRVHNKAPVGKEAVKKELDDLHRYGQDSPLGFLRMADSYRTIEETESAEKFTALAVQNSLRKLRDSSSYADSSDSYVVSCFEVLDKTGKLDKFLEEISLEIAQDYSGNTKISGARYGFLHNYLAYRKVERGEADRVYRAGVELEEIVGLWLALKSRGKALLDLQREQNDQLILSITKTTQS